MQNKLFFTIIFLGLAVSVFPASGNVAETNRFLENFYWYNKYLPQGSIAELYTLHNTLLFLKDNNKSEYEKFSDTVIGRIQALNSTTFQVLNDGLPQKTYKMEALQEKYNASTEIKSLSNEYYKFFKTRVERNEFPDDDLCLDVIEYYYSDKVTEPGYTLVQYETAGDRTYRTQYGDYFRKIAAKHADMGYDESKWKIIYEANKTNKALLPTNNPDVIGIGVEIIIPALPPKK